MPEIILDGLTKSYGDTKAADGLSLTVRDGEYLCILGPTGAGKTTCLRMICGLTKPDFGKVLFDGADVCNTPISERRTTMLSQVYSLFPPLTVYENVMFSPKIKEWPEDDSRQLVKSMLRMVHMDHKIHQLPHELSGGQQQRTALARALASDSKVLLLDEPLRALDARLRLELRKELKSMAKEMKLTTIHVTHDQDEALEMADRIAIIRNGKIVQVGTPMEVFAEPSTPFVANFVGRSNMFIGKMGKVSGDISEVILKDSTKVAARKSDVPEGKDIVLAVKVGSVKLERPPSGDSEDQEDDKRRPAAEGFFRAKVERILYEGATITVEVHSDRLGLISSRLPNRRYGDFAIGDEVSVRWVPEMAKVFDIPPENVESELRLD